jgi:hypothetical protein
MEIKSQRGQTVVEYILLMVVAISLVLTFYKSAAFKRLFGEQGMMGRQVKSQTEYSYRHASPKRDPNTADISKTNKDGASHPSYADLENGGTRFFGPKRGYPP